jgi:CheY-like chemotaxis protein
VSASCAATCAFARKSAMFAAEVARGAVRRSSLNEFLETSRDASSQLVANLNRAAELITSFKQVAADRTYSDQRSFDLGDLTEQVVMSLRPGLRKHNLVLTVDCQPNLVMNSYPGPYGQVLTNLFLNSVAHAFPDGKPGAVDIKVRESGKDNVEIVFSDNGCGMSLDVRRRAFDPFFTTKEAGKGTGLGLATVYGIVKQSGGYVWVYSEPGHGTSLKLYFPEVSAATAFQPGEYKPATREASRGSETILVVEDEEAVRGLTSRILEKQGYRVLSAQHGREAMDIATKEVGIIDLVLTDIVMPGMNGRGLVERLAGIRPRMKSLYMSGYTDDDIIRRGFIDPSKSFLQKPFTSEALLQTVRKVLDEG